MAKETKSREKEPEKKVSEKSKKSEKSAENRNLSAYSRIAKKVEAADIKSSKTDLKSSSFKVTATVAGTTKYVGLLEHNDGNSIVVTSKRPRSSKVDTLVLKKEDILSMHGTVVGKATQIVVTSEELHQEVVGKISVNGPILTVKCEDGSSVELNTNKVRLDIVRL